MSIAERQTDTQRLTRLQTLDLPVAKATGAPAIRLCDVPLDLRAALDQFQFLAARPVIDGATCVWIHDWQAFLRTEIHELHLGMEAGSRALGAVGPTAADLATAPLLEDWIISCQPRSGDPRLLGRPTGHPVCRGPLTRTSALCGIDPAGTWARTISRWYRLSGQRSATEFLEIYGAGAARFLGDPITIEAAIEQLKTTRPPAD